jgi:2-keto-4-pentenoate hydratase/2-oxohepta-3-ene-1,7-dioic acid hydratase in catechol pathway
MATPVLALVCDGASYDVAALEERARPGLVAPSDFHARVVSLSCAGLRELDQRVRAGFRPAAARLLPGEFLPLAPCDTDRAALVQMGPYELDASHPVFRHRDARGLVGDEQSISFPEQVEHPDVEASLAVLLREDLWRATAEQATRAVLGYALLLDWAASCTLDRWPCRPPELDAGIQLGPTLVTADEVRQVSELPVRMRLNEHEWSAGLVGDWTYAAAESLAYVSQHVELRAGDVIAAGRFRGASPGPRVGSLRYGDRVSVAVERLGALTGRAVRGPALGRWRAASPALA